MVAGLATSQLTHGIIPRLSNTDPYLGQIPLLSLFLTPTTVALVGRNA
jgi:hypothetical protein